MYSQASFRPVCTAFVPNFLVKIPAENRNKKVNGALISRGCSHVLKWGLPLLTRVLVPPNVNKMLTVKKVL